MTYAWEVEGDLLDPTISQSEFPISQLSNSTPEKYLPITLSNCMHIYMPKPRRLICILSRPEDGTEVIYQVPAIESWTLPTLASGQMGTNIEICT